VFLFSASIYSQSESTITSSSQSETTSRNENLLPKDTQIALSTQDYRVTAGDVYALSYAAGTQPVQYKIVVDLTYRIRVANLGVVDGNNKTFAQLKTQVETIVNNNYPLGGVQFTLTQPASFKVLVTGEVKNSREVTTWALGRLSSLLDDNLTDFASLRDVTVQPAGGRAKTYDLFLASRTGDFTQNPYLRPNDTITFNRVKRMVTINGAVERPGTYQLKDGENIKNLIEFYSSGFTPNADKTRIELVRQVNSDSPSGEKIFLTDKEIADNYILENYDTIMVPQITSLKPVMFVEGAVGSSDLASPTVATRLVVPFNRGENYASLIRANRSWFSAVSDTKNAYIIRGEEQLSINLNPILYDENYYSPNLIEENDTLIIPFRQYFITVAGAVVAPGRYPYIPDRQWDYYIALAGGFVPGRNAYEAIVIKDINGKTMKKTDIIVPETIITAKTNDFLYYFNQYAPIITTTLSILSTSLALYTALRAQ
jgi:protein involved in polysaccharide export with SLBB domain